MVALTALAVIAAVTAATRSTWSPCGVSMLSTITPVTEAARGRRYGLTIVWFLGGALLGGLCFGLIAGLAALAASAAALAPDTALGVAAVAAMCAAALDGRILGLALPGHGRQVNETWLTRFRSWVYGAGFGWQIGSGLATYIVTAGVYLTLLLAGLTADVPTAVGLGALFGSVRGSAILLGRRLTSYERLAAFHRRFEGAREASRRTTIGVQLLLGIAAAGLAWGPTGVVAAVVVAGAVAVGTRPDQLRARAQRPGLTVPVDLGDRPDQVARAPMSTTA